MYAIRSYYAGGRIPGKGRAAEGIVAAGQAYLVAVIEAGHAYPAEQPAQRQLHLFPIPAQQGQAAGGVVAVQQVEQAQLLGVAEPRITSYNVCYTKLLRHRGGHP